MKKLLYPALLCSVFLALALVSGCSAIRETNRQVATRADEATAYMENIRDVGQGRDPLGRGLKAFTSREGLYIDGAPLRIDPARTLLSGKTITLAETGYLADLGDKITRATGLTVRFAPDLSKRKDVANMTMSVKHKGSLTALLDSIASYYSVFWECQNDGIVFYSTKTSTFTLVAFLTDVEASSNVSNKADTSGDEASTGDVTGGASGSTEQSVSAKGKYAGFEDCVAAVKAMLSNNGSVTFSRGMGTITVTDSPLVLAKIDSYVREINAKLSRQVALNVGLYSYSLRDGLDLGYNLSAAFKDSSISIIGAGVTPGIVGGNNFTATILQGANNNWIGSEAVLQALKEKGNVSMITTGSGLTMNNQPLPIQALKRTGYLAASSSSISNDITEVSLEPGQVVSGLSILVTPHMQPDDRVLIEYSMSYSTLDDLKEVKSGNSSIQTPEVSSRNLFQRVTVRPGSTIVLAGLSQDFLSNKKNYGLFSAGLGNSNEREFLIVVIDVADATLPEGNRG